MYSKSVNNIENGKSKTKTKTKGNGKIRHIYKKIKHKTRKIHKFIGKRLKSRRHLDKMRHHLYYY